MSAVLVVKFGGDALATPERIAAAARHLAARRSQGPVVAVASARRGVTDHLLGLVAGVQTSIGAGRSVSRRGREAAERAVASGELVSVSLLALALDQLGVPAEPLDARQAGIAGGGSAVDRGIVAVRPSRLQVLLRHGAVPVVAGFQAWHRGRVRTLGRGGSDTTAVALATAIGAGECELVKETGGILDADPRLVADARLLPAISHHFLTELALAGAKVMHHPAAVLAERAGLRLRFAALGSGSAAGTLVGSGDGTAVAIAVREGVVPGERIVSVVTASPSPGLALSRALDEAPSRSGARLLHTASLPHLRTFLVPTEDVPALVSALHGVLPATATVEDQAWMAELTA